MADDLEQDLRHIHWCAVRGGTANTHQVMARGHRGQPGALARDARSGVRLAAHRQPLTRRMDYFAFSPFWDSKSNNNVLRTQRRIENPTYGHAEEKVELTAFRTGFEYIVAHARAPDVFVIHRRDVLPDGGRGPVTHAYFILQDKVYMSPNLHDIAATRLRNATHLLSSSFSALSSSKPAANPRATAQWRALPPGQEKDKEKDSSKGQQDKERRDSVVAGTPAGLDTPAPASAAAQDEKDAAPDWHLFHALSATRASLAELDRLAASPEAQADAEAETRAFDALAQAAIGRGGGPGAQPLLAGGTPRPPLLGTPAAFTPGESFRPLRPASNFAPSLAADSPAV